VALSFFYLAFLRTMQMLRLRRSDEFDLASRSSCSGTRWPSVDAKWFDLLCDLRIERSSPASAG